MESATREPRLPPLAGLLLARELNSGGLEPATACFLRDGCLITPDATAIHGRDAIRPVLAQLIASRIEIEVQLRDSIRGGGSVLVQERWRVRSGGIGNPRLVQTWTPTLVLREVEASWKLAIAAPWGWG